MTKIIQVVGSSRVWYWIQIWVGFISPNLSYLKLSLQTKEATQLLICCQWGLGWWLISSVLVLLGWGGSPFDVASSYHFLMLYKIQWLLIDVRQLKLGKIKTSTNTLPCAETIFNKREHCLQGPWMYENNDGNGQNQVVGIINQVVGMFLEMVTLAWTDT